MRKNQRYKNTNTLILYFFHRLSPSFCVLLLTKEVPIYTVQQLMCHSDIGSTKVYADLLNKTKLKAVRKLPTLTC
jgi:site-specific recombinase XerD